MPNCGSQSDLFDWSETGVSTQYVQRRIKACTADISQIQNLEKKQHFKSKFDYYNSGQKKSINGWTGVTSHMIVCNNVYDVQYSSSSSEEI